MPFSEGVIMGLLFLLEKHNKQTNMFTSFTPQGNCSF